MKLADLYAAGRSPALPLRLQLPDGELELLQWLRVLPGRRYVAVAAWDGRRVVAKLLVGRRAARHFRRECEGTSGLAAAKLDAPNLLASGYSPGEGGWLLFDYLENAPSLGDLWQAVAGLTPLAQEQIAVLGPALKAIGTLHARGVWQEDLHLNNLLCHHDKLYWIDAGSIRSAVPAKPLKVDQAVANLGVFLAQLPASFDVFVDALLSYYQQGGGASQLPIKLLRHRIGEIRPRRLREYLGKVGRDCTEFSVSCGPMEMRAVRRDEFTALQPLMADPDHYINQGEILKAGRSSTVARISLEGRLLVVKRYNIKGFTHWLRRFWRPSRAWHSWREGHRLAFLGVATPQPLAMLERRYLWLRSCSYLISEWADGDDILTRFAPHVNGLPPEQEQAALENLFAVLTRERISHGDLKGTNLIWRRGKWALIDLDAMRQHRAGRSFAGAYARDRARFLRNWPADSPLFQWLDLRLPRGQEHQNHG